MQVKERWKDRRNKSIRMTLLHSSGEVQNHEVMVYNSKSKANEYYVVGDEFDGGELVYVHPRGGIVRRQDDYFLYPIGEKMDTDYRADETEDYPVLKELADFDFSCVSSPHKQRVLELAQGSYIQKAEPILMVGNPGLGKTHIAIGLALAACRQGYQVRFYNAAGLVNDLILAQDEHRLPKFLNTALRHQLIVLDELGFIPLVSTGAHLVFQFCSTLHERVALIVTTNLRFADWVQVFGDERLTAALLDRLTHRATILEFLGESYRFRQRVQREAQQEGDV